MSSIAEIESNRPHGVTIPGAVDSWCRLLADHGTREVAELLAAAIALAEIGYPAHHRVAWDWQREAERLRASPAAREIFLPGGRPPARGL